MQIKIHSYKKKFLSSETQFEGLCLITRGISQFCGLAHFVPRKEMTTRK